MLWYILKLLILLPLIAGLAWGCLKLAQKLQDPGTAGHLLDLDAVQLESQAATLVGKRWRAVSELIPESSLGNSSLTAALFRESSR